MTQQKLKPPGQFGTQIIKPNAYDGPDWKFPYAHRAYIEQLRSRFCQPKKKPHGWKEVKKTRALPIAEAAKLRKWTRWPSVAPEHRERTELYFQHLLEKAKREGKELTPGIIRSRRMLAAFYGRQCLTHKWGGWLAGYYFARKMWRFYLQWEEEQKQQQKQQDLPRTPSKILDIG